MSTESPLEKQADAKVIAPAAVAGGGGESDSSTGEVADAVYIDPEKERAVVRKFDYFVLPQFFIILLIAYLDRSNVGNARIFGFEDDLGLKGNEFGNINSLFFITYVIFEVPWVLVMKKFGANAVIATEIIFWSVVTLATGFIKNYHQALAMRLLLGVAEAGIFPAVVMMMSTIYPRHSQAKRVAVFYGANALSGAFGGLIAFGIQSMGDRQGIRAWRWLFIVEGAVSIFIGGVCWLTLPTSAEKAWFLTEDEKALMRARKERDVAYVGAHSDKSIDWTYVWAASTDLLVWVAGLSLFCAGLPMFGFGIFLPTLIRGMGFESHAVNYLTIPVYVTSCIILFVFTYISDRLRKRAVVAMFVPLIAITGYAIAVGSDNNAAGFFAMFLCSGVYTYNTLLVAWVSNNITPDLKRSAALPLFVSIANISGVASSQVYPSWNSPRYVMGNSISLGMEFLAAVGIGFIWFMLRRRNQIKAKLRAEGVTDNGKIGDKGLDFEYIL